MSRRSVAGIILIGLGFVLLGSQMSADPGRLIFGLALLVLWGGTGAAVVAGRSWSRLVGLALAGVGVAVAGCELGQAGPGGSLFLVDVFFVARDPHFAWINVAAAALAFALLSALAGALLLRPIRRSALGTGLVLTGLLAGLVVGCSLSGVRVPPGGQQVHVVGTGTGVRLDPPTVRAGDVYLVIDGSALFFQAMEGPDQSPGPMTEDGLTRLAQSGDMFHTASTELYPGYAGNVYRYTLTAGSYAFLPVLNEEQPDGELMARSELCARDPRTCAALPRLSMAVLEVLP